MWQAPKTDWKAADVFTLDVDYERIRSNMQHLQTLAKQLFAAIELKQMANCSNKDYLYTDFFDNIDSNVYRLLSNSFKRKNQPIGREYFENDSIFTPDDLNRIENAQLTLFYDMQSAAQNRAFLKFTLGGGIFAAAI